MNKKAMAMKTIVTMIILIVIMFIMIGIASGATSDAKELIIKFFDIFR